MTRPPLKPGDRVKYSANFLSSVGLYTRSAAYRRGTVRKILTGFADAVAVDWDDHQHGEEPALTASGNLHLIGTPEPA